MKTAIAFAALFLLAACGQPQSTGYPAEYEFNFMRACQAAGSSNAICACVWGRIASEISPGDFEALEDLPQAEREVHPMTAQIQGYRTSCVAETPSETPAETP